MCAVLKLLAGNEVKWQTLKRCQIIILDFRFYTNKYARLYMHATPILSLHLDIETEVLYF